jgi:hypothetical protein
MVWNVADQHASIQSPFTQQRAERHFREIRAHHFDIRTVRELRTQLFHEPAVQLEGDEARAGSGDEPRQHAAPGTQLHDDVVRPNSRGRDDLRGDAAVV